MKITLTFDNGPHARVTPEVLDTLAEHGIKAAFFVVGRQLQGTAEREVLERLSAAGHRIGNHSFSHTIPLGELSDEAAVQEIAATEALLGAHGVERLFRPFGRRGLMGEHMMNAAAWRYLIEHRYSCILWNCLAREWERPDDWAAPTLAACETNPWSVVVIHDVLSTVPAQLHLLLRGLADRGCTYSQDFPDDCVALRAGVPTAAAAILLPENTLRFIEEVQS